MERIYYICIYRKFNSTGKYGKISPKDNYIDRGLECSYAAWSHRLAISINTVSAVIDNLVDMKMIVIPNSGKFTSFNRCETHVNDCGWDHIDGKTSIPSEEKNTIDESLYEKCLVLRNLGRRLGISI